jgi:hypothetical protein
VFNFTPLQLNAKKNLTPIQYDVALAPDAVWTVLKKIKSLAYAYTMVL